MGSRCIRVVNAVSFVSDLLFFFFFFVSARHLSETVCKVELRLRGAGVSSVKSNESSSC
jgi:hypothetical protein